MWNLSSLTRNQSCTPWGGSMESKTGPSEKSPCSITFYCCVSNIHKLSGLKMPLINSSGFWRWEVLAGSSGFSAYVSAKSLQSCPTHCDPMDCSPPDSCVDGIRQAAILEWVCPALLQGIFRARGPNTRLLHPLHWQAGSSPLAPPFCLGAHKTQNQGADNLGSHLEALGRHLLPNSFRLLAERSSDGCRTVSLLSATDNTYNPFHGVPQPAKSARECPVFLMSVSLASSSAASLRTFSAFQRLVWVDSAHLEHSLNCICKTSFSRLPLGVTPGGESHGRHLRNLPTIPDYLYRQINILSWWIQAVNKEGMARLASSPLRYFLI